MTRHCFPPNGARAGARTDRRTRAFFALTLSLLLVGSSLEARAQGDLLVQLPLDEGSGTVAGDASGNGNDGTLVGGPVFEASTGDGSPFAVRFDGSDDAIDLGVLDVNGSGLTLSAWLNADSFPGPAKDPRIISKATGTGANDHVFMLSTLKSGGVVRLRGRLRAWWRASGATRP
jgi:hypothetical protein